MNRSGITRSSPPPSMSRRKRNESNAQDMVPKKKPKNQSEPDGILEVTAVETTAQTGKIKGRTSGKSKRKGAR
jgi:hypothetical protein